MGRGIVSRGACLPCDPLRFSPRPADLCLAHISPPTPVHPPLLPPPHQPIDSPQYTDQSTDPPFISLRRAHFRVTASQHARRAGEGRSNRKDFGALSPQRPPASLVVGAGGRRQKAEGIERKTYLCSRLHREPAPAAAAAETADRQEGGRRRLPSQRTTSG